MDVLQTIQNWDASLSLNEKDNLRKRLAIAINELLLDDFDKLVQLLYRVDVSEQKLKNVLAANQEKDAGDLIADLLIKRQEEKLAFRQAFPPANNMAEDDRW